MTEVTLYGHPGCGLCVEARRQLEALRAGGLQFRLREVDIDRDEVLLARYLERVPVIEVGGETICELGLDAHALRARLDTVSP